MDERAHTLSERRAIVAWADAEWWGSRRVAKPPLEAWCRLAQYGVLGLSRTPSTVRMHGRGAPRGGSLRPNPLSGNSSCRTLLVRRARDRSVIAPRHGLAPSTPDVLEGRQQKQSWTRPRSTSYHAVLVIDVDVGTPDSDRPTTHRAPRRTASGGSAPVPPRFLHDTRSCELHIRP